MIRLLIPPGSQPGAAASDPSRTESAARGRAGSGTRKATYTRRRPPAPAASLGGFPRGSATGGVAGRDYPGLPDRHGRPGSERPAGWRVGQPVARQLRRQYPSARSLIGGFHAGERGCDNLRSPGPRDACGKLPGEDRRDTHSHSQCGQSQSIRDRHAFSQPDADHKADGYSPTTHAIGDSTPGDHLRGQLDAGTLHRGDDRTGVLLPRSRDADGRDVRCRRRVVPWV